MLRKISVEGIGMNYADGRDFTSTDTRAKSPLECDISLTQESEIDTPFEHRDHKARDPKAQDPGLPAQSSS